LYASKDVDNYERPLNMIFTPRGVCGDS